jgi:hypothetical protein
VGRRLTDFKNRLLQHYPLIRPFLGMFPQHFCTGIFAYHVKDPWRMPVSEREMGTTGEVQARR